MKRGNHIGRVGLAVVLCAVIIGTACSTAWVGEAEQIVAAMIPAAANIVTLVAALQGKSVSAGDLAMVQNAGTQASADLQLIQSLIAAYQQADDSAKPGILNQIQSAIVAVQGNLQGLLQGLHIKDSATQTKVQAVIGIVLSEVQSLAAVVPMIQSPSAAQAKLSDSHVAQSPREMGHATVSRPAVPLSANEFVKSYNATMTAKTGNAELDKASAGLKIHLHSSVERWGTAGLLE